MQKQSNYSNIDSGTEKILLNEIKNIQFKSNQFMYSCNKESRRKKEMALYPMGWKTKWRTVMFKSCISYNKRYQILSLGKVFDGL